MSLQTPERIRTLQRRLYAKAKKEPRYRFYTLYDKISRWDTLEHAYHRARANAGAPGVDEVTFEQIAATGVEEFLRGIQRDLQEGTYRAAPVRRLVRTGGRLVKHARYFWLLLAEGHLTRRLFVAIVQRLRVLSVPAG